ncbi:proteinase [Streptococcus oralis subsp. oralis]|jgi:C3-degrading proteinase|uniref:Proteinase n=1 Tax=Streptococcus oralis subsp. oralis TaxID=1891914 RepID=A0A1X1HBZ8_STROR|nr:MULTISPECIES: CppA N-terminal domain-containing protein [Streptococcus]MDN5014949.1 proteinase [Streptococcus sp. SO2]ORO58422.1 proteinase [Streptococcus oralis subsp. oralis]ORO60401.1 proteinase [Streptococcus oralis subsp. oralis]
MKVNEIVRIVPTLKVNNRKLNERFYIETLGMKPLLEESAFLSLGDQTAKERLILEEAPSMRTRRVEGLKKLARLLIKVENPSEIEALLSQMKSFPRLFKGNRGYAFEIVSPEEDVILVHAEDDIRDLVPLETVPEFYSNTSIKYVSQFEVSVELRLPEDRESLLDSEFATNAITFTQGQGPDLAVENNVTWDLSMLKFLVKDLELTSLRQKFEGTDYFIPKSEKFFLGKDTNKIELWFEEA